MPSPLSLYDSGFLEVFDGTINWKDAANIAAVLCTADYAPAAAHATYDQLTNEVASGGDYEPKAVPTRNITRDGNEVRFTSGKVLFGENVSISARYLVLVVGDPSNLQAGDKLIGYVDFNEVKSSTAAEFSYTAPADGWFKVSRS